MADSGDDGVGSGFTIKEIRPEHVEDAGSALFTAFYVDSLATGVPPTYIIASPEEGSSLLESFLPQPRRKSASWSMYAEWGCMCSCRWATLCEPQFIRPRGRKAVMRSLVQHAHKLNAPSIRLTTSAANRKSFCLYISLGFRPVECTSAFFGTVHPDAGECAAFAVGISTDGISTRKMEEADVKVCAEIYSKGMGYDREDDIKAMLTKSPERCWVATTEDNTILGYTTGLFLAGHTMTTSEAAWVASSREQSHQSEGWRRIGDINTRCSLSSPYQVGAGYEARACKAYLVHGDREVPTAEG